MTGFLVTRITIKWLKAKPTQFIRLQLWPDTDVTMFKKLFVHRHHDYSDRNEQNGATVDSPDVPRVPPRTQPMSRARQASVESDSFLQQPMSEPRDSGYRTDRTSSGMSRYRDSGTGTDSITGSSASTPRHSTSTSWLQHNFEAASELDPIEEQLAQEQANQIQTLIANHVPGSNDNSMESSLDDPRYVTMNALDTYREAYRSRLGLDRSQSSDLDNSDPQPAPDLSFLRSKSESHQEIAAPRSRAEEVQQLAQAIKISQHEDALNSNANGMSLMTSGVPNGKSEPSSLIAHGSSIGPQIIVDSMSRIQLVRKLQDLKVDYKSIRSDSGLRDALHRAMSEPDPPTVDEGEKFSETAMSPFTPDTIANPHCLPENANSPQQDGVSNSINSGAVPLSNITIDPALLASLASMSRLELAMDLSSRGIRYSEAAEAPELLVLLVMHISASKKDRESSRTVNHKPLPKRPLRAASETVEAHTQPVPPVAYQRRRSLSESDSSAGEVPPIPPRNKGFGSDNTVSLAPVKPLLPSLSASELRDSIPPALPPRSPISPITPIFRSFTSPTLGPKQTSSRPLASLKPRPPPPPDDSDIESDESGGVVIDRLAVPKGQASDIVFSGTESVKFIAPSSSGKQSVFCHRRGSVVDYEMGHVVRVQKSGRKLGLKLVEVIGDGVFISGVVPGGLASNEAMIESGRKLLEINGQNVRAHSKSGCVDLITGALEDASSTTLTLMISQRAAALQVMENAMAASNA